MPDSALDILKMVMLVLLYLFFARVLWAVWSEVRQPVNARSGDHGPMPATAPPVDPTPGRIPRPIRGKGDSPGRLVVLEPKERRGTAFSINQVIGIGREDDNIIRITDDAYVSGHHARVSPIEGGVVVDDLGSRNGTYLNGMKLADRRPVRVGDRLQIGYTVLEAQ
jgi:pSer/pThr/pTyr-binding forkhead associated (FHA) protein